MPPKPVKKSVKKGRSRQGRLVVAGGAAAVAEQGKAALMLQEVT